MTAWHASFVVAATLGGWATISSLCGVLGAGDKRQRQADSGFVVGAVAASICWWLGWMAFS